MSTNRFYLSHETFKVFKAYFSSSPPPPMYFPQKSGIVYGNVITNGVVWYPVSCSACEGAGKQKLITSYRIIKKYFMALEHFQRKFLCDK